MRQKCGAKAPKTGGTADLEFALSSLLGAFLFSAVEERKPEYMYFHVKTTYTKDMITELYKVASVTTQKKLNTFPEMFFRIGGIALIACGVVLLFMDGTPRQIIISFVAGVFALVYHKLVQKMISSSMWKNAPKDRLSNEFSFDDEAMHCDDGVDKLDIPYENVFAVYETDSAFYVFPAKNQSYILPKAGFDAGESADFKGFIEEKTGKTVGRLALK